MPDPPGVAAERGATPPRAHAPRDMTPGPQSPPDADALDAAAAPDAADAGAGTAPAAPVVGELDDALAAASALDADAAAAAAPAADDALGFAANAAPDAGAAALEVAAAAAALPNGRAARADPAPLVVPLPPLLSNPTSRWRVKVYCLQDGAWHDGGTGSCWGEIVDGTAYVIVEDELAPETRLLESVLVGAVNYQKQDTLIVWSERAPGSTGDAGAGAGPAPTLELALSFQEAQGCLTLCEFILYVGTALEPDIALFAAPPAQPGAAPGDEPAERILRSPPLPELPRADNIARVIRDFGEAGQTLYGRDALGVYLKQQDYLEATVALFAAIESAPAPALVADSSAAGEPAAIATQPKPLTSKQRLHILRQLSQLIRLIFSLADTSLINLILEDDVFPGVLGILEYDIDFAPKKASLRKYFAEHTHLNQTSLIEDQAIAEKIKKTFRLQFLKDVVLARVLDDSAFGLVSSLIFVNHMEVVVWLQQSPHFTAALFSQYKEEDGTVLRTEARDTGLRLIYQIVSTSKSFPHQQRLNLYLIMVENGVFQAIGYGLKYASAELRNLTLEVVGAMLEVDSSLGRPPPELTDYNSGIVDGLVHVLIDDKDMGMQIQALDSLKLFLESPLPEEDEEAFYKTVAPTLFGTLATRSGFPNADVPHYYELVLDLLSFCSKHHAQFGDLASKSELWRAVGEHIMRPVNKTAALAAVKSLKSMITWSSAEDMDAMVKSGTLSAVLELINDIGNINNAVHSACLQLLTIISRDSAPKYAFLRHWLSENEQERLAKLDYLPFIRHIGYDDTSDDEGRGLKRQSYSSADDSRLSRRRRLDLENDLDEHDADASDVSMADSRTPERGGDAMASPVSEAKSSPVISSPPPEMFNMGSPPQGSTSPSLSRMISDISEPHNGDGYHGHNHSFDLGAFEEPDTPPRPLPQLQTTPAADERSLNQPTKLFEGQWEDEPADAPGSPPAKQARGKLQRKLFSAGQSAKKLVTFKKLKKDRPAQERSTTT